MCARTKEQVTSNGHKKGRVGHPKEGKRCIDCHELLSQNKTITRTSFLPMFLTEPATTPQIRLGLLDEQRSETWVLSGVSTA